MRIAQCPDIKWLTTLAIWLWVGLSARCIDGGGTAQARRVPDVDCVKYWNGVIYVINSRTRRSAHYIFIKPLNVCARRHDARLVRTVAQGPQRYSAPPQTRPWRASDGRAAQTVRRQGRGGASLSVFVEVVAARAVAQKRVTRSFSTFRNQTTGDPWRATFAHKDCKILLDTGLGSCFD